MATKLRQYTLDANNGITTVAYIDVPAGGSVSSVAQTFTGGLISVAGSPITTSGTLALTVAGTSGGVPYFSGAATWASSGVLAASALMVGGGAGAAPATVTTGTGVITALGVNTGSAGAVVLFNGAGGTPSSMTATNVTGTAAGLTAGTASAVAVGGITGLGTNVATALAVNVGSAGAFVTFNGALGTPSTGTLTNCTFPTLNQNTTGSAGSLLSTATTGLMTITGPGAGTTRVKTIRNANDTLLELGGSYTPTGTWTSLTMVTPVLGTPTSGNGTNITNVNAAQLGGATFASPTSIGSGTPAAVTGTTLTASTGDISATAGFVTLAADGKGFKSTYSTGTVADSATATLTLASGCGILLLRESNTTGAWALFGCSVDLAAMVKIDSGGAGIAWTVTKDTAASVNVYQGAGGGGTGNVIIQNKTGSNKAFKACWLLAV